MSIASLKETAQGELALGVLSGHDQEGVRVWGWANSTLAQHLPAGSRVALDASVVPIEHRDLSPDPPAQLATIVDWDSWNILLELADGAQVWMRTDRFLDAVFDDKAGDAP